MTKILTKVFLITKNIHDSPDGYCPVQDTLLFHYIWTGNMKTDRTPQLQNSLSKRTVHSAESTIHTTNLTVPQDVIKRLR